MKRIAFLFAFCWLLSTAPAQHAQPALQQGVEETDLPAQLAATITASELKAHLFRLASDEMEGRETGTEGQRRAAKYLAQQFAALGLPPIGADSSYFQPIVFSAQRWNPNGIAIKVNGKSFKHLWDFYAFPADNPDRPRIQTRQVLFLGYGIDDEKYSDYTGLKTEGAVGLIYAGEPTRPDGRSHLTGTEERSDWSTDLNKKLAAARAHGLQALLILDGDIRRSINRNRSRLLGRGLQIGAPKADSTALAHAFVSTDVFKAIAGKKLQKLIENRDRINASGRPAPLKLKTRLTLQFDKEVNQLLGANVLGFVEGLDADLKDEVVVVSAHYDHLGKKGKSIYYGADDNGTGTSAVLEIAEAFAEARRQGLGPRRSVLFLLVSGEEKGLLGSEYYAAHPLFPLENTIANVNVDMIGRTDKHHQGNPDYIYVIGSDRLSTDLHRINEEANARYTHLLLDYTYNAPDDPNRFYYRSDHYNFAKNGIPAIFYFSGVHEDYHQPTDTPDKIEYERMEKIARLIFHTTWELANRPERIRVDK